MALADPKLPSGVGVGVSDRVRAPRLLRWWGGLDRWGSFSTGATTMSPQPEPDTDLLYLLSITSMVALVLPVGAPGDSYQDLAAAGITRCPAGRRPTLTRRARPSLRRTSSEDGS